MTHLDTMKQALKFIEATNKSSSFWLVPDSNLNKTATALRLAIEQAQKQEPVSFGEAEEQALKVHDHLAKALRIPTIPWPDPYAHGHEAAARAIHASHCEMRFAVMDAIGALTALRAALAAACAPPQRQPECQHRMTDARNKFVESGYVCVDCGAAFAAAHHAPPQRQPEQEPVCETTEWAQVFGAGVKAGRTYLAAKEPVGVMMVRVQPDGTKVCKPEFYEGKTPQAHELLYTAPPQRQPLIPEALQVIDDLYDWRTTEGRMKAYRAIERAHGIGGEE